MVRYQGHTRTEEVLATYSDTAGEKQTLVMLPGSWNTANCWKKSKVLQTRDAQVKWMNFICCTCYDFFCYRCCPQKLILLRELYKQKIVHWNSGKMNAKNQEIILGCLTYAYNRRVSKKNVRNIRKNWKTKKFSNKPSSASSTEHLR